MIAGRQTKFYSLALHGFFLVLYACLSLLNHFYFRSAGLDYGLANQALYQYAHWQPAIVTQLLGGEPLPYLACHLSFWVPILSPFYWIFGSYTLLLAQLGALILASLGFQQLAKVSSLPDSIGLLLALQFYVSLFVLSAYGFDYHDNVMGAAFFPWMILHFRKGNWIQSSLCFLIMLLSKENMAIWAGFVALGLPFLVEQRTKKTYLFSFAFFGFALAYYLLASYVIMPYLSGGGQFLQLQRYSHLGASFTEIIGHIFKHPWDTFSLFWSSHVPNDSDVKMKWEFLKVLLVSGGIVLLRKPVFLWMALPLLMQKLWNKESAFWGIAYHYQIELAVLISVGLWFWIKELNNEKLRVYLLLFVAICTIGMSIRKFQNRYSSYQPIKEDILTVAHYQSNLPISVLNKKIESIPTDAVVCAQANLLPHLSFRDKVYHFPHIKEAKYFLFFEPGLNTYPLNDKEAPAFIDSLRKSNYWVEDSSAIPLRVFIRK